jgi:hypothetical protein
MSAPLLIAALVTAGAVGCSFDRSGAAADPGGAAGGDDPAAGPDAAAVSAPPDGAVQAPASCAEALRAGVTTSGVIQIDPGGAGPFAAYCDMKTDGGGWTLAMKIDGRRSTFRYTSPLWTTEDLFNPDAPDRDRTEAKLASFNRVAFTEVLIRFDTDVDTDTVSRWVWMDLAGDDLRSLFAADEYVPVYLGRERWLGAIPDAHLQENCNREGVNAGVELNKVRLGIIANDQDDCFTPESKLGVGSSFSCQSCGSCGGLAGPAAGSNDAGCTVVQSFATVLVR